MTRALVLGLDVGDGHLVRRWAADGELPHLARLIADGAWGWLATPAETLHVSAWPSLYTGTHPGEHGVYYTFQPARGVQGARRFTGEQYRRPTLWRIVADAGKRCVVLDAPYTHPEPVTGVRAGEVVFEWGTWAHYWKPGSSPEGLYKELVRAVGEYPLGLEANRIGLVSLEPRDLLGKLETSLAAKARAIRWMLERGPWDLGVAVFGETHLGTHYLWPGELEPEAAAAAKPADLLALYRALDAAIGTVLEATTEADAVYVVSGDGGGPNHSGWHLLPEVLRRLGFTKRPGEPDGAWRPPEQVEATGSRRSGGGLLSKLRGAIPDDVRQAVSRHLPSGVRDALMKRNRAAETDWTRTRAYCLPTDLEGCIRFNVKGREPEGIVEPGELDALCEELASSLRALVNPATGEPAAARVVRTAEAFPPASGPGALDALPDLIVVWDGRAPIRAVRSDAVGTVEEPSPDERVGTHRPPGFAIARGPGLAPGSELAGADVLDFAPTVLGHLAVRPPAHVTGRAWTS